MLALRLRRWPNSEPTLGQCLAFAALPCSCNYIYATTSYYFRPGHQSRDNDTRKCCARMRKTNERLAGSAMQHSTVHQDRIRASSPPLTDPAGISDRDSWIDAAVQRQTAVTAYLKSKQLLLFGFAWHNDT